MALLLGIDTGGTFTDAVLVDADTELVVATAKAPTTHQQLVVGVREAMAAVLAAGPQGSPLASQVGLVSVSTTLATNALVEGMGEPACLVTMGFTHAELERAGIPESIAQAGDQLIATTGGHNAHGAEVAAPHLDDIARMVDEIAGDVSGFAVAAAFSVRNPAHELAVQDLLRKRTGKPVTCSHALSARLNGPRRALTALLNARLIGMIADLAAAVEAASGEHGIDAPLMMVRGDGTLVSAEFAASRPIETVLSGPAASVVGARHLTNLADALVVDMGGTTTDVAIVRNGQPSITTDGAVVAGHRTMVQAVDMVTAGLGGDSEVRIDSRKGDRPIVLGPARAIPMCRLAVQHPEAVHRLLDLELSSQMGVSSQHGRMLVPVLPDGYQISRHDDRELAVLEALRDGPVSLRDAAPTGLHLNAVERLRQRGLVRIATLTPTDAAHVAGLQTGGDLDAARKVAELLARQQDSRGLAVAADAAALAQDILSEVVVRASELLLAVTLEADGLPAAAAVSPVVTAGVRGAAEPASRPLTRIEVGLAAPVVALGAPAVTYYPHVAARLSTTGEVPQHADVANAVGSVVGRVSVQRTATVTQPSKGQFRLHMDEQPTFGSAERARDAGFERLGQLARNDAMAAGAADPELRQSWAPTTAMVEGKEVFVEAEVTVEASGRPRLG